jgi:hypothetical protein
LIIDDLTKIPQALGDKEEVNGLSKHARFLLANRHHVTDFH